MREARRRFCSQARGGAPAAAACASRRGRRARARRRTWSSSRGPVEAGARARMRRAGRRGDPYLNSRSRRPTALQHTCGSENPPLLLFAPPTGGWSLRRACVGPRSTDAATMDMKYEGTRSLARPRRCPLRVPLRPPPIPPSLVRSNHNPSPPSERATADVSLSLARPRIGRPSSGDVPIELIEEALQHGGRAWRSTGAALSPRPAPPLVPCRCGFPDPLRGARAGADSAEESAAILSVAWSRDGRKLMSSAADGSLTVWDVAEADDVFRHTFDARRPSRAVQPRQSLPRARVPLRRRDA